MKHRGPAINLTHTVAAAVLSVLSLSVSPETRAAVHVCPSVFKLDAGGTIASWLQLGPVPGATQSTKHLQVQSLFDRLKTGGIEHLPRAGDPAAGTHWRTAIGRYGVVTIEGGGPRTSYLAAVLRTETPGRRWLSLGSDGSLAVWLGGELRLHRDLVRRFSADTDLISLDLAKGDNLLVIKLWKKDQGPWRLVARLMDTDFGPPDKSVAVVLPGCTRPLHQLIKQAGRLVVDRHIDLDRGAMSVKVNLAFDGGRPIAGHMPAKISFTGPGAPDPTSQTIDLTPQGPTQYALAQFEFDKHPGPAAIAVDVAGAQFSKQLSFFMTHVQSLAQAWADLKKSREHPDLPQSSIESAHWRVAHLKSLIEAGDEDFRYLNRELRKTRKVTKTLASRIDFYATARARIQRRGFRSRIDDSWSYYTLYVPPGWRDTTEKRFGLVVVLHGLRSSPMKAMQTIFGQPLEEGETKEMRERHPKPVDPVRFFVLAPSGFGSSGYRAFGEVDVMQALDQVRSRYPIDPDRIYIAGASMGGTGAVSLTLHYPDQFAATVALCGYHSLWVRNAIRNAPLRSWEKTLIRVRSNVAWAENGQYVPLYLVHGLQDTLRHSKVLADQYRKLTYQVRYDTPDLPHNVWDETYKDRQIFKYLKQYKRTTHPSDLVFTTGNLRYRSSAWVEIDGATDYASWSRFKGTWGEDNHITANTSNISALTLCNTQPGTADEPLTLQIDGQSVQLPPGVAAWSLHRDDTAWRLGARPPSGQLEKRPGLAGPIGDALYERLLFVYGTADPGETALSKRLIQYLKQPTRGVTVNWPVKADIEVTEKDIAQYSLVIVGTTAGNRLLAKMRDNLPIRVLEDGIVLGKKQYKGPSTAASFIYPNPLNNSRYVVVHTGVSKEAVFYTAHLPALVPDYVIYDATHWGKKQGLVLGHRQVLDAGFFDTHWQPTKTDPPYSKQPGAPSGSGSPQ
ncbi:MAG: alpha/beta hydrolase-fold protein [Myxococcota bacterium]|nr:alpha/beta hydrolase-fold protein [Myxococcota bacterium]